MINSKDKEYLLRLKPEDIDFKLLEDLLSDKAKVVNGKVIKIPSKMNTFDEFDLQVGEYMNKTKVRTNVGLFLFNKIIVERDFKDVVGYWNDVIDGKTLGKFEALLANALTNKKISKSAMDNYFDRVQWLSFKMHMILSGSFTMNTLKPNKKVVAFRDKYIKENKEKLETGDIVTGIKLESEALSIASKELSDDPGMDLYKSKSRGSFDNNFKSISVMKGPMYNPILGRSEIVTTNFMEGIAKKDIATYANGIIAGAYPKAVGTQDSGHLGKKLIALLQTTKINDKVKDCGSKNYMTVLITNSNKNEFNLRYIIEGSKIVLLDDTNYSKYVGRVVKMRSPLYCIGKDLCVHCAGTSHINQGIKNMGLTSTRVASTMLNMSMKKFHDTSAKMNEIDLSVISI